MLADGSSDEGFGWVCLIYLMFGLFQTRRLCADINGKAHKRFRKSGPPVERLLVRNVSRLLSADRVRGVDGGCEGCEHVVNVDGNETEQKIVANLKHGKRLDPPTSKPPSTQRTRSISSVDIIIIAPQLPPRTCSIFINQCAFQSYVLQKSNIILQPVLWFGAGRWRF